MNYIYRAQQIANKYRLSVINPGPSLDLVKLIADEMVQVAREARKEVRRMIKEKELELNQSDVQCQEPASGEVSESTVSVQCGTVEKPNRRRRSKPGTL